jgi:hypothetical protein
MKKINLLLFLAFSVLLLSCNQDDEAQFVKQDFLKGVWKVFETGTKNTQGIIKYVGVTECDSTSYTFGGDKSFEEKNFTLNNQICTATNITGTFVLEDNKTLISYKNATGKELFHTKRILSLGFNEMEIVYTDSISQELIYKRLLKK